MRRLIISYLLIIFYINGQTTDLRHNPEIQWQTIHSKHFSVHISKQYLDYGISISKLCEEIYPLVCNSLGNFPQKTNVVVHTEIDYSDGFTTNFPWRMELFITEPQGYNVSANVSFIKALIIHEFTHIVHLRKKRGLSALTFPFLGQYNSFWQTVTPLWFTEGIATLNETCFSYGGRGRNPHFWMQMAAPIYNNDSWSIGSTNYYSRKRTPTKMMRYVAGYQLAYYAFDNNGNDVWKKILNEYSEIPIFGFNRAIRKITGLSKEAIYNNIITEFDSLKQIPKKNNCKIWYRTMSIEGQYSPRWVDNNKIAYYQNNIGEKRQLVEVNRDGDKRKLLNRKMSKLNSCFSISNNTIYTSELITNSKYSAQKYSDLYKYDIYTGDSERLTKNKRLYSIDISPDGAQLVAVQSQVPGNRLAIISSQSGEILNYVAIPQFIIQNPRWSPDGKNIAFTIKDSNSVSNIASYNIKLSQWRYLYTPNTFQDNHPCWSHDGNIIYYSSDQSGIFNIWAVELATGSRWMITYVEFGAFTPDVSQSGREIAYTIYTNEGFRIASARLDEMDWKKSTRINQMNKMLYTEKSNINILAKPEGSFKYSISDYSPLKQLMPQGWIPYVFAEEEGSGVAVFAQSQDVLKRHSWFGRFGMSLNRLKPAYDLNYIYSKWFPKLSFRIFSLPQKVRNDTEIGWWRKNGFETGISTSLLLENNIYRSLLNTSINLIFNQTKLIKGNIDPSYNSYSAFRFQLSASRANYIHRDITPHIGYFVNSQLELSHPSLWSDYNSQRIVSELDIFLPTPVFHNNVELFLKHIYTKGDYIYNNFSAAPIGYGIDSNSNHLRSKLSYYLTLAYVEWQAPYIPFYIEYVYIKPFIDIGTSWDKTVDITTDNLQIATGFQLSVKSILFFRYDIELGLEVYSTKLNKEVRLNPFIKFILYRKEKAGSLLDFGDANRVTRFY